MVARNSRYTIEKHEQYLYALKESITDIHPVYKNSPLNLYLLLGSKKALLIDTGCKIEPLKPIVENLIGNRELIVINSHAHWDHVLGNVDFREVHIHQNEAEIVSRPYNVSFLRDSPCDTIKAYEKYNFMIPPARSIRTLQDGDEFDLGDLNIEIIHAPGHSSGSICLLTNRNELFTGDVAYYGEHFLPKREQFYIVLNSLDKLIQICESKQKIRLYPSHTKTPVNTNLLFKLRKSIKNIDNLWDKRKMNHFFHSYEIKDKDFIFYVSLF